MITQLADAGGSDTGASANASPGVQAMASSWSDARYTCRNLTVVDSSHVSCQAGPFSHGTYALVVTLSTGVELAAAQTLFSVLKVTAVSPPLGSIGGGYGFDGTDPSSNVVVVPVPVSTSYPNDEERSCSFSYSWAVTPRVDSIDPPVFDGTATTLLRIDGSFVVHQLTRALLLPSQAAPEAVAAAAAVFRSPGNANSSIPECTVQSANGSAVECMLPSGLLPGSWQVILVHSNGEMSVTNNPDVLTASGGSAVANVPRTVAQAAAAATRPPTFILRPVVSAVSAQASGVGGGSSVTVTLAQGGCTFDVQHPEVNRVLVGGVPCTLDSAALTDKSLSVVTPPVTGRYFAEYWQLPVDNWDMPVFSNLGPAHTRSGLALLFEDK
eukprot:gene14471-14588_t